MNGVSKYEDIEEEERQQLKEEIFDMRASIESMKERIDTLMRKLEER